MRDLDYWEKSAPAWIALMERGDRNRTLTLDPAMLRLAGDVGGSTVCDIGCGEGRFCRMLAERGAVTTGIDPSANLIHQARLADPSGTYVRANAEFLPFASDSFDLVTCYLVLIDIYDYCLAIKEMARVAKLGGRILVANMNSFTTTLPNPWIRNESGDLQHVVVSDYFEERADVIAWSGIEVVNYHRPFEAYMSAFLGAELSLTHFEEPQPSAEAVVANRRMAAWRIPNFHVMQWRKE